MSDEEATVAATPLRIRAAFQDWSSGFRGRGLEWEEFLALEKKRWAEADSLIERQEAEMARFQATGEIAISVYRPARLPSGRRLAPGTYTIQARTQRVSRPRRVVVARRASRPRRARVSAGRSPDDPSGEPPSPLAAADRRVEDSGFQQALQAALRLSRDELEVLADHVRIRLIWLEREGWAV